VDSGAPGDAGRRRARRPLHPASRVARRDGRRRGGARRRARTPLEALPPGGDRPAGGTARQRSAANRAGGARRPTGACAVERGRVHPCPTGQCTGGGVRPRAGRAVGSSCGKLGSSGGAGAARAGTAAQRRAAARRAAPRCSTRPDASGPGRVRGGAGGDGRRGRGEAGGERGGLPARSRRALHGSATRGDRPAAARVRPRALPAADGGPVP